MNDSKNARSNLTKSRWLRLSASVGLALGLAVVMLMLPLFAGTTVTVPVPQLSSAPDTAGKANWSLTSSSVQLDLPFAVKSVSAVGGIAVQKTSNFTTVYQGGLAFPSTFEPGEIVYTIVATNNTGSTINPPFYISDTVPAGTVCAKTDNNGFAAWTHNLATCESTRVAQFTLVSGTWAAGDKVSFLMHVLPDGKSGGFAQSNIINGVYTVTNSSVQLHNPAGIGSFNGGFVATTDATDKVNVQTAVKAPVWNVYKEPDDDTVASTGGQVTYNVHIQNTGPYTLNPNVFNIAPLTNKSWVTITEWLPTGVVSGPITYTMSQPGFVVPPTITNPTKIMWVITNSKFYIAANGSDGIGGVTVGSVTYTTTNGLFAGHEIINDNYTVEGGDNVFYPGKGGPVTVTVKGPGFLTVTKTSSGGTGAGGDVKPGGWDRVNNTPIAGDTINYTIMFTYGSVIETVSLEDTLPVNESVYPLTHLATGNNLLVDYTGGNFSGVCAPTTTAYTVTTVGSPVTSLLIKGSKGFSGTHCTVTIPVKMRSFMVDEMEVINYIDATPVVTSININNTPNTTSGELTDYVEVTGGITFTKVAYPNVINPNATDKTFEYTLIVTNSSTNGWDAITLTDQLTNTGNYSGWAKFVGTEPVYEGGLFHFANEYSKSQSYWPGNITPSLVITSGTDKDYRYWIMKVEVMTDAPGAATGGIFTNTLMITTSTQSALPIPSDNGKVTVATAQLTVTKWSNFAPGTKVDPGGTIVYTFVVSNMGTLPVKDIVLTDTFTSGTGSSTKVISSGYTETGVISGFALSLAGGKSTTATFTYTVKATDVSTTTTPKVITNDVKVTAVISDYPNISSKPVSTSSYTVEVKISPTITVSKHATYSTTPSRVAAGLTLPTWGDTITYTYIVTNNYTEIAYLKNLVDQPLGTIAPVNFGPPVQIPPLSFTTFITTVPVDDALIAKTIVNNGGALSAPRLWITNVVTATAAFTGTDLPFYTYTVVTEITYTTKFSMAKVLTNTTTTRTVDSILNYFLYITNTGSVTLNLNSIITDLLVGDATPYTPSLAPAFTVTIPNSASAPNGQLIPGKAISIPYDITVDAKLVYYAVLSTSTNGPITASVGSGTGNGLLTNTAYVSFTPGISYTFAISNNPTLQNYLTNTVGTGNGKDVVTSQSISVPFTYTAGLTVVKTADRMTATVGEKVTFYIWVTNTGQVPLSNITMTDIISYYGLAGPIQSVDTLLTATLPITKLEPAIGMVLYTHSYTVNAVLGTIPFSNQALLTNTAWVTGQFRISDVYGSVFTVTNNGSKSITTEIATSLHIDKQVGSSSGIFPVKLGDTVIYTYTITNLSPLSVTKIVVSDDKCETFVIGYCPTPPKMTTLPTFTLSATGEASSTKVITATALVNEAFIRQALRQTPSSLTLHNTAWAEGELASGVAVKGITASQNVTIDLTTNAITFTKKATILDSKGTIKADQTKASIEDIISYTLVVSNDNNIGYHAISISDVDPFGLVGKVVDLATPLDDLNTCNVSVTNAKIQPPIIAALSRFTQTCAITVTPNIMAYIKLYGVPTSTLVNNAVITVTPSLLIREPAAVSVTGLAPKVSSVLTAAVLLTSPTQILLSKSVTPLTATVGDKVTYVYTITNNGSVAFEAQYNPTGGGAIVLYDDKLGEILFPGKLTLTPTESTQVITTHVVTYSDYSSGITLTNTAVATGYVAAAFKSVVPSVPATASVSLAYTVNVNIVKSSNRFITEVLSLGEKVVYTLALSNTGNIPVTVTLKDVYDNGAATQSSDFPTTVWVPANTTVITSYHDSVLPAYLDSSIVTQTLHNVVTATVTDGFGNLNQLVAGNVYTDVDEEILTAIYDLNIEVVKSTSTPIVHFDAATKTVTYNYVLKNTGKTTQTVTSLVDEFNNDPALVITLATNIVLGPGQSTTVITNVGITDAYLDYAIAKGQAVVSNTATANVNSSGNNVPFNSNPVTVTVFYTPSLKVIKSASINEALIGDTITYTVLVANDGLVTLRNIVFEDRLLGVINKTSLNMSPGGVPAQFIVTKTISQKDFDTLEEGGVITNTANVTGSRGMQDYPFDSNTVTVTIRSGAKLALTKVGSATSVQVPATVAYTYTVTNNGTVDLTNITLTDDKLTLGVTPFALVKNGVKVVTASTLLSTANQTVTNLATAQALFGTTPVVATATWTVKTTAAPVTATCTVAVAAVSPVVVNTASAMTATVTASPTGTSTFAWNFGDGGTGTVNPISHTYTTTGTKSVTVTVTHSNGSTCAATTQIQVNPANVPAPNLVVTKSTERPQILAVGTRITYTIRVSNTGNTTATNVVITDALPVEVTLVASSTTAGTITVNGSTVKVDVSSVPQATSVVVTIVVDVDNDGLGKGTIVNTAFVSSLEQSVANSGKVTDPADLNDAAQVIKKPKVYVFLPIILKQPTTGTVTPTPVTPTATPATPVPGQPNLQSTIKLPASVVANQDLDVEVVVKNAGTAAVTQGFWVEFYINPNDAAGITTRGGRWDSDENLGTLADPLGKQGIAWFVKASDFGGSLAPGASITLVSRPAGDSGLSGRVGYEVDQTTWHGSFVSGTSVLVSYADSFAGSGKNVYLVTESNENDNANTANNFGSLGVAGVDLTKGPFHPAR